MSHSAAHFPVEPLIFCRAIKERGRSLKGQTRRMCKKIPKLLYPVEKWSSWFSANITMRKSLPFIPAHVTHFSRLSHGKTHTRAAPRWEEDSVSQPTFTISMIPFNLSPSAGPQHSAFNSHGKGMLC